MRMFTLSMLGLSVALAQGAASAAPSLTLERTPIDAQASQWLAPAPALKQGGRLQLAAKALQVLDGQGRVLGELPGRFETLDHRAEGDGLLVATLDKQRQQALLARFDASSGWGAPHYLPATRYAIEGLCLYRDSAANDFLFLVGEEGIGEQWLVAEHAQPLAEARLVRSLSLPPQSAFCQVDDASHSLFINEENVGLWRYPAAAEAPLLREPVDLVAPFGGLAKAVAGMAVVPGGLLALDPAARALHLYQRSAGQWLRAGTLSLQGLKEPEQVSARVAGKGLELLLADDQGTHRGVLGWAPQAPHSQPPVAQVKALVQTDGVPSLGDAADDPAIWVHPRQPALSRVFGTDKKGGLLAYDLQGKQLQDLRVGRLNNVDVRGGFQYGAHLVDLAVASNRDRNSLHLFAIDPASGELSDIGQVPTELKEIYGLCLFKDSEQAIHAIANDKDGRFVQYRLDASNGQVTGTLVRSFSTATQSEGCVADDRSQRLFIAEEDVAVWALDARAEGSTQLDKVLGVGGPVQDDIEGLALYHGKGGDYLVVSSQGNDRYVVVDAAPPYRLRGSFQVGLNGALGIDGASETDGLEVTSANLGGPWAEGLLVVQDGRKRMPEGKQNYKYVPWAAVAQALGLN
ncbi:phytase [Pantoea sp. Tr-811]|uniref:phytase n=1 Tax=Pantoea sp. Tr-811 TaxID=2608361 RepID=UPI001962E6E8|nr:phytase [Pantoea sp. Tr-811]